MSKDRLAAIAERIVARARRKGDASRSRVRMRRRISRKALPSGQSGRGVGFTLLSAGKVMAVPQGPVIFAPILQSGRVPADGTWTVEGREPAGIELEIAFRLGRDVAPGASPGRCSMPWRAPGSSSSCARGRISPTPPSSRAIIMLADCIAQRRARRRVRDPRVAQREPEGAGGPPARRRQGPCRGQERRPYSGPADAASSACPARQVARCRP